MKNDVSHKYRQYCRPTFSFLMSSIRMDKAYHEAIGDRLYYSEDGKSIGVLDFLGGFGASMFGHNHPELVKVAQAGYQDNLPFNSQASCRCNASFLAEKLDQMMFARTGKHYISIFGNSGTESVEAALKHAEFHQFNRIQHLHASIDKKAVLIRRGYDRGELAISPEFYAQAAKRVDLAPGMSLKEVLQKIQMYNIIALQESPCFLCLDNSFHGKTTGSLKLTHSARYKLPFHRIGLEAQSIDYTRDCAFEEAIEKASVTYLSPEVNEKGEVFIEEKTFVNISGLFMEPLQGEGGINVIPKNVLMRGRQLCEEHGFPLIFDEIQSGMGRTGTFLFSEQQGVRADYYILSKSLGGGLSKISVLLIDRDCYVKDFDLIHTSTFAEDDHSAQIAYAALDLLEKDKLMERCTRRGTQLIEGLRSIQKEFPGVIGDVRGAGLMVGMQLSNQYNVESYFFQGMSDQNFITFFAAGYLLHEHNIRVFPTMSDTGTIRLEPSAYISHEDCEKLLTSVRRLCEIIYKHNLYEMIKFCVGAETPGSFHPVKDYRRTIPVPPPCEKLRQVGFIGHFVDSEDLRETDMSFENFTVDQLDLIFEKLFPLSDPLVGRKMVIKSVTGEQVVFNFIGLLLNSRIIADNIINGTLDDIHALVVSAVEKTKEMGCSVVGFGGFSSIVTKNCTDIVTDAIGCTSGNSFTVAMGIEALFRKVSDEKMDLGMSCLAVIGATGNICSVYSEIAAEKIPRIILIGRKGKEARLRQVAADIYSNAFNEILLAQQEARGTGTNGEASWESGLSGVAGKIYSTPPVQHLLEMHHSVDDVGAWLFDALTKEMGDRAPIVATSDYGYLKEANLIVSASNVAEPVIFPHMLRKGPVVICDIAVPADTDESVTRTRDDVHVILGGIVNLPKNHDFQLPGVPLLKKGEAFACMSETILLGLHGMKENFSYGRITKQNVERISEIARTHGFGLARTKVGRSY